MWCCVINGTGRYYSRLLGCLFSSAFWKLFSFCQAGLYSTHATTGNVWKEDIAMEVVGLNNRFNFFRHKISVAPIVSTVSGTDSLP